MSISTGSRLPARTATTWKLLAVFSLALNGAFVLLTALQHHWQVWLSAPTQRPPCHLTANSHNSGFPADVAPPSPPAAELVPQVPCDASGNYRLRFDESWLASFRTWQDETRRQFLGRLPKLQPHYCGPTAVGQLNKSSAVFATFTNAAPVYVEQLLNWAYHLRELGLPHLVVCLDDESLDIARSNGIPWLEAANKTTSDDVRNDHATFRAMVARKVDLARALLEEHAFREVVWTDTDVVWLRSPLAFLGEHPSADIAVQTDCLSHALEAAFAGPGVHRFARCGHLPGNAHNNAFNTGMLVLRNRAATRAFLTAWLAHLLDGSRMFADLGGGRTAVVGDQLALNRLMTAGSQPWVSVNATADWRVVWAHEQQLKLLPLPALMFAGGHTFFVQHQAARFNTTPFYAHACLVPGHVPAKVTRFREHNLWAVESDEYYSRGAFLLYDNTVQAFIAGLQAKALRRIPDLYKHMLAVSYQLEVALEVLAMAAALGRTPVLPKMWCWCDFDWYAVVLDGCAMGGRPGTSGADLFEMPFECPLDVLMDAAALYRHSGAYRQQRFLDHRRTPPALARSREPVLVVDGGDEALMRERQQMMDNTAVGVFVPTGVTDEGLRVQLRRWRGVRLLDFRNVVPGTFGGFTDHAAAAAVDALAFELFGRNRWCCSGEQPMAVERLEWPYAMPERLVDRVQGAGVHIVQPPPERAVPRYARPDFCDDIRTDALNAKFLQYENHPCTFLAMDLGLAGTVRQALAE